MRCPFISGKYFKSCSVGREPYVPSAFEMAEYCTTTRHTLCPFFARREQGLSFERRAGVAGMAMRR